MFTKLEPGVYRVIPYEKGYALRYEFDRYVVASKLYGKVRALIYRIDRLIAHRLFDRISVLFTGRKGLGKTTSMNTIMNKLIDVGIPIIEIKYITVTVELVEFLASFQNVGISIDEFARLFPMSEQDKILTLLNQTGNNYRSFFFGEYHINKINRAILSRMERMNYHLDVNRLDNESLLEYGADRGIPKHIMDNLIRINKTTSNVSYDTLDGIVKENELFPELSFEELTSVLNCQEILGVMMCKIDNVSIVGTSDYIVAGYRQVASSWGDINVEYSAFVEGKSNIHMEITLRDISSNNGDVVVVANNNDRLSRESISSANLVSIDDDVGCTAMHTISMGGVVLAELKIDIVSDLVIKDVGNYS